MIMTQWADLHIHTSFSDSTLSPREVVAEAKAQNLYCIAITDHDTVAGIQPAIDAAKDRGLEVIPGIELSCAMNGKDIHILGYCLDYQNQDFARKLAEIQDSRLERIKAMIKKLENLGVGRIDLNEVILPDAPPQSVGRPHLALALHKKGIVSSVKEAFDKYLADCAPAYVPKYKQTPAEGIAFIKQYGGVAVLAHPMVTNVDELIPGMVRAGLGGIEVVYPYASTITRDFYKKLAKKYHLLVTGGSDGHGKAKVNTFIGKERIPYEWVELLKRRGT